MCDDIILVKHREIIVDMRKENELREDTDGEERKKKHKKSLKLSSQIHFNDLCSPYFVIKMMNCLLLLRFISGGRY